MAEADAGPPASSTAIGGEGRVKRWGSVSPPVPVDGPATRFSGGNDPDAGWLLASHNSDKQVRPRRPWPKGAVAIGEADGRGGRSHRGKLLAKPDRAAYIQAPVQDAPSERARNQRIAFAAVLSVTRKRMPITWSERPSVVSRING